MHNSIAESSLISLEHSTSTDVPVKRTMVYWVADSVFCFICMTNQQKKIPTKTDHHHKSVELYKKWPYQKTLNLVHPTLILGVSWLFSHFLPIILKYSVDIKNQCLVSAHSLTQTHSKKTPPDNIFVNVIGRSGLETSRKCSVYFGNKNTCVCACVSMR